MTSQVLNDDVLFTGNFGNRRSTRYREGGMAKPKRSDSEKSLFDFFNEDFGNSNKQSKHRSDTVLTENYENLPAFLREMKEEANRIANENATKHDIEDATKQGNQDYNEISVSKSPSFNVGENINKTSVHIDNGSGDEGVKADEISNKSDKKNVKVDEIPMNNESLVNHESETKGVDLKEDTQTSGNYTFSTTNVSDVLGNDIQSIKDDGNVSRLSPMTDDLLVETGKRSRISSLGDEYEELFEEGDGVSLISDVIVDNNDKKGEALPENSNQSPVVDGKVTEEVITFHTPTEESVHLDLKSGGNSPVNVKVDSFKEAESVVTGKSVSIVSLIGSEVDDTKSETEIVDDIILPNETVPKLPSSEKDMEDVFETQEVGNDTAMVHVAEQDEEKIEPSKELASEKLEETEENLTIVDTAIQHAIKDFHMAGEDSELHSSVTGNEVVTSAKNTTLKEKDVKNAWGKKSDPYNEFKSKPNESKSKKVIKPPKQELPKLKGNHNWNSRRGKTIKKRPGYSSDSIQSESESLLKVEKMYSTDLSMYSSDFDQLVEKLRTDKTSTSGSPHRKDGSELRRSLDSSRKSSPYCGNYGNTNSPYKSRKDSPQYSNTFTSISTVSANRKSYPEYNGSVKFPAIDNRTRIQLTHPASDTGSDSFSDVDINQKQRIKQPRVQNRGDTRTLPEDKLAFPENGGVPVRLKSEAIYRNGQLEVSITDERERLSDNIDMKITLVHKHMNVTKNVKKKPKLPKLNFGVNRDIVKQRAMFPPFNTLINPDASKRYRDAFGM